MRLLVALLARHRRFVLLLPWAVTLIVLVKFNGYQAFLRPAFRWLLIVGYLILVLLICAELFRSERADSGAATLLPPAILLVPLLYLANGRGAELDGYAFGKRLLGAPHVAQRDAASPGTPPPRATNDAQLWDFLRSASSRPQPAVPRVDASGTQVLTILDLYRAPEQYEGKRVAIVGMALRNEDVRKEFGPGAFLAFRFRVTCCAADAQPFAVVAKPIHGQPEFPDNAWIEARGRFSLRPSRGERIPVIEDALVSAAATPVPKYLY
ncbi:MAG TPA: hypothetical protein VMK12_18720 [Anaeromyxobacteraceae bacterium]|nr:hypothetical protein [Anaeromyxobacteraceae bacterium]